MRARAEFEESVSSGIISRKRHPDFVIPHIGYFSVAYVDFEIGLIRSGDGDCLCA